MARSSKYVKFSFAISEYYPDILQGPDYTERELRREYARLRDVAQKNIKRLGASRYRETDVYKYNVNRFKKTREITGSPAERKSELAHLLSDIARFLTSERRLLSGMDRYVKRNVESLNDSGYDFVTFENFLQFADFMDVIHGLYPHIDYPSKTMPVIEQAMEKGVTPEQLKQNFDAYMENYKNTGSIIPESDADE